GLSAKPGSWEFSPECCAVADNWRLGGVRRLDRVQANLCFSSELYQLGCRCRPVLRERARHIGGGSFPSPPGRSTQSTIAPPCPAHLPQWPGWRASRRLRHAEWQASGWGQRALRVGFREPASEQNCAGNSCGASALVWVCGARTCCLRSLLRPRFCFSTASTLR